MIPKFQDDWWCLMQKFLRHPKYNQTNKVPKTYFKAQRKTSIWFEYFFWQNTKVHADKHILEVFEYLWDFIF